MGNLSPREEEEALSVLGRLRSGNVDILTPLGGDSDEIIRFVYVDGSGFGSHKVLSGQLHILDEAPPGTQSECLLAGHVIFTP